MTLALQQRIVVRQLARVLFQHHGHAFPDRERQAFGAAYEHRGLTLVLEWTLADGTGEDVEQSFFHRIRSQPPVLKAWTRASTRSMRPRDSASANSAVTGTYQQRSSANAA